jgi:hypothetical protein
MTPSSENVFQSCKCIHAYAAAFVALDLNPRDAAAFGQRRLTMTAKQRGWVLSVFFFCQVVIVAVVARCY